MRPLICTLSVAALVLGGCSSTINRPIVLDTQPSATSVSLDGKQRLVIAVDRNDGSGKRRAICAEPTPDALVGIAASAAAGANYMGKVDANVSASLAEAVQTVGRRTQTIQLLRDGLYRACEAYVNGALTAEEYKQLVAGIDQFAITLVAIDGLTGGLNVPASILNPKTTGKAGAGQTEKNGAGGAETAAEGAGAPPTLPEIQISEKNAAAVQDIVKEYLKNQVELVKVHAELNPISPEARRELERAKLDVEIARLKLQKATLDGQLKKALDTQTAATPAQTAEAAK